jgi:hypothetical protein
MIWLPSGTSGRFVTGRPVVKDSSGAIESLSTGCNSTFGLDIRNIANIDNSFAVGGNLRI